MNRKLKIFEKETHSSWKYACEKSLWVKFPFMVLKNDNISLGMFSKLNDTVTIG